MRLFDKLFIKNIYEGKEVTLKEKYRVSSEETYDGVATVYYDIFANELDKKVGTIDLRLTVDGFMYYYGHIGYNIIEKYRGHNYAYYACKILFRIAKEEFKMYSLIITCSPDNIASLKTLKRLNGELVELANLPDDHPLYKAGETKKYIFKYDLNVVLE